MNSAVKSTKRRSRENQDPRRKSETKPKARGTMPVWTGPEYSRIPPGKYTASAVRIVGPEFVARWQRSSIGIAFRPHSEVDAEVILFRNLGTGEVKRGSLYYRDWTRANGGPPTKDQVMDPAVFFEGQIYEIEVADSTKDCDGDAVSDAEVYSRVKRIISVQRSGDSRPVVPFHARR